MGTAAGTRLLTTGCYLTDDQTALVYVLDLPEQGEAVVEDCSNGDILCVKTAALNGWRLVIPEEDSDA